MAPLVLLVRDADVPSGLTACSEAHSKTSRPPPPLYQIDRFTRASRLEPLGLHDNIPWRLERGCEPDALLSVKNNGNDIHLPTHLPPAPADVAQVDLSSLVVDSEFEGPIGFVRAKLKTMGPSLLHTSTTTTIHVPAGPALPAYLHCTIPSSTTSPLSFPPSHILAIRSPDSPRTLLLPAHGLLWASASPGLSLLSSSPSLQPPTRYLPQSPAPTPSSLPVLELSLPSSLAVPLLQSWLYLASPSVLLSSLLPTPTPTALPSSLSKILNPAPEPCVMTAEALSHLPAATLLERVSLVHGLWQDTVALEIGDEELWRTMGVAWSLLVGALVLAEQRRTGA